MNPSKKKKKKFQRKRKWGKAKKSQEREKRKRKRKKRKRNEKENASFWHVRAFLSNMSKNIAFSISKPNFITYNTPLYNTTYIKTSSFLPFHLNSVSLLFFNNFLFLLSPVSFSSISPQWDPLNKKIIYGLQLVNSAVSNKRLHCSSITKIIPFKTFDGTSFWVKNAIKKKDF